MRTWLGIALVSFLLASCGVKGPPLPPESNPAPEPSPTASPAASKRK